MKRRELLSAAGIGLAASVVPALRPASAFAEGIQDNQLLGKSLKPPSDGPVRVGFVLATPFVPIDWVGPLQAFAEAFLGAVRGSVAGGPLFESYTMTALGEPASTGGAKIEPKYSFANAPQPHVLVVPGQGISPAAIAYIKDAGSRADVTMSVCTGAFLVAQAGLFDGLRATTHHSGYDRFERSFPKVTLVRGVKFVENANVSASGGETSGIDLALRVIERYYGAQASRNAAYGMEYRRTARPQSINEV